MKLVKLSLAAVVAVGAMTTFASAKPLEEAIKGVEISGFARYRFESNDGDMHKATYDVNGTRLTPGSQQRNRFSGLLNITSPVTDDLKFGMSLAYDSKELARDEASKHSTSPVVNKFWFQYAINDFTVKAGKFEIATPWTDSGFGGSRGNGILAAYTGLEGFTFAGAYFNQTNLKAGGLDIGEEDLFAGAVIGKVGPVGFQVWGARMEHIIDYAVFAEADVNIEGFNAKGQVAQLKLTKEAKNLLGTDKAKGMFYGATVGYANDQFNVDLGYTKNSKKQEVYAFTDGSDGFIEFGKQLGEDGTFNVAGMRTIFIEGGFNYEKFGFEAGYGYAKAKSAGVTSSKWAELYAQVSYDVAKNFDLQLYYSMLDDKARNSDEDNNKLRFQARYKF